MGARAWTSAEYREYLRTGRWPSTAPVVTIEGEQAKRHKYNVGPRHLRQVDGYTFDSIAERKRYEELRMREKAGLICELRVHPCWPLVVNGVAIGEYEADFSYRGTYEGKPAWHVVEDVKGVKTAVYRLKRLLMKALHDIEIEEVK